MEYASEPFGTYSPCAFERALISLCRAMPESWLGRRVAFALRKLAMSFLKRQPRDVETLGIKMRLYPFDNIADKRLLYTPQYFDAKERAALEAALTPDFVFLDVGANVGGYALFVSVRTGGRARILALEPQPQVFDRLSFNIAQNPRGNVKAIACAVADQDGEMTLFLAPGNQGEASLKLMSADPDAGHAVRVPAQTLFGLVQSEGLSRIDALKIDIEGAEDLVLFPFFQNAPEALWPKLMILEVGEGRWQRDLMGLLRERGYETQMQTRLNFVLRRAG
jgi:FkbM family methyltransferase